MQTNWAEEETWRANEHVSRCRENWYCGKACQKIQAGKEGLVVPRKRTFCVPISWSVTRVRRREACLAIGEGDEVHMETGVVRQVTWRNGKYFVQECAL